jgi:hypothetical protein
MSIKPRVLQQVSRLSQKQPRARRAIKQVTATLDEAANQQAESRLADRRDSEAALQDMLRPFVEVIQSDPSASSGLARLRKAKLASLAPLGRSESPGGGLATAALTLPLSERYSFAIPPYDFEWKWGNSIQAFASKGDGRIGVIGGSGRVRGGTDDAVAAASGIGLILISNTATHVAVRPYIDVSWEYVVAAAGLWANGFAQGGIDAAAFLDGKFIAGVRRTTEFSASRGTGTHSDSGGSVVWIPDIELNFAMAPGKPYIVNYGAWVECDHTSGIGQAAGTGKVEGRVRYVVVERTPF